MENPLYFDYQASTPLPEEVSLKMQPYFTEWFANPHSSEHALGWKSSAAVENAGQQVANLIGADADEIVFTSGATEANNLALLGLARKAKQLGNKRNRILFSAIEHKSVLALGRVLEEQYDYTVETVPVDNRGRIIKSSLAKQLGSDVLLVSIMAVNNEIGSIQDVDTLSELIRDHGAIFHSDASQAPLAMSISHFAQSTDLVSLSAHKMYGPKGIGALYVRRDLRKEVEPLIYGGDQQNGLRSGTLPTPLCVGMGAAAEYVSSDTAHALRRQLGVLRNYFFELITALPLSVNLCGPELSQRHPGNISISFPDFNAQEILGALQPCLAASSGSACTSGIPEPSHVLKAIGLSTETAESVIRFSFGFETQREDIEKAVQLIEQTLGRLSYQ